MQRVLITGASRGIGRAAAVGCGARGWRVGINYRTERREAEAVCAEVCAVGSQAIALQGDVTQEQDVLDIFDKAVQAFGGLDGVVVNAGVVAPKSLLADMDAARLRRMFEINIFGAYLCAREAARRLSNDRGGTGGAIVLISSAASRTGSPSEFVDYAGSKGAIDTLTLGLSKELGPKGVRVNCVRPGVINTEIHARGGRPEKVEQVGSRSPLGRPGNPEEVADAIIWLLSDAAAYTTGAILDVTGGL